MTEPTEADLAEITRLRDRLDQELAVAGRTRAELHAKIRAVLPPPGVVSRSGAITKVVKASRWTRAQVDNIRNGKTKDWPAYPA